MRESAPAYAGEGSHTLWHVSEDAAIERFEPRGEPPLVWAIDTRHQPLYWFPRECPRATFWAETTTSDADVDRFLGGDRTRRSHAIESAWLQRMHESRVVAYRIPEPTFVQDEDRFWVSVEPVEPLELVELGDLVARHAAAAIELLTMSDLLDFWHSVTASTLGFSGIRLRNARMPL